SDCSSAAQRSAEVSAMNTLWNPNRITRAWFVASLAFALTGCFQEKSDQNNSVDTLGGPTVTPAAPATPQTSASPAAINHSPDITGDPPVSVDARTSVTFEPKATDEEGEFLEFSATNLPTWAKFD